MSMYAIRLAVVQIAKAAGLTYQEFEAWLDEHENDALPDTYEEAWDLQDQLTVWALKRRNR